MKTRGGLTPPLKRLVIYPLSLLSFFLPSVHAHCPLCTMGAAAAAGGALWLGVSPAVVAVFIGAFAISMGLWIGRMIKKEYVKYQVHWLALISFLTTVLPIFPLLKTGTPADYYPVLVSIAGEYGTLLNKTYLLSVPLIAAIIGGAIVYAAAPLSAQVTKLRGKTIAFQGVIITLALLLIAGIITQLLVM